MFFKKFEQYLKRRGGDLFALICLIGTVWTVVATSSSNGSFSGVYQVKSDCVSPAIDQAVTFSNASITSSSNLSYSSLGFPVNALSVGDDNNGTLNNIYRTCKLAYTNDDRYGTFFYTCNDNGQYVCNIFFTRTGS